MLSLEQKMDRFKFSSALGATGFGAMSFALFPLLSAFTILYLTFGLFHYHKRWTENDTFPPPEISSLKTREKYILFTIILTASILFSFSNPLSQIFVGTLASLALSYYFITQCIIEPQKKLNNALQNETCPMRIRALLKRGAEPPNGIYEKITFKSIFGEMKKFRTQTFFNTVKICYHAIPNRIAFYAASEKLLKEIMDTLSAVFNKTVKYLQQKTYRHEIDDHETDSFENDDLANKQENECFYVTLLINAKKSESIKPAEEMPPPEKQTLSTGRKHNACAI